MLPKPNGPQIAKIFSIEIFRYMVYPIPRGNAPLALTDSTKAAFEDRTAGSLSFLRPMIALDRFNGVYTQYVDDVFRVALRDVSRRDIAEEITTEAFLALFQLAENVSLDQLPGWLFNFVQRCAPDYWLRWYQNQTWADSPESEQISSPQHHPAISFEGLLASCSPLKPVHRACLILHFIHGMTRHEIASHTGLTESEIKGHLYYGIRLFHGMLASTDASFPGQELPADA